MTEVGFDFLAQRSLDGRSTMAMRVAVESARPAEILVQASYSASEPNGVKHQGFVVHDELPDSLGQVFRWDEFEGGYRAKTAKSIPVVLVRTIRSSFDGMTLFEAPATILIDGPVEDQQAVSSFLLNLCSGVNPTGPTAPFGLSNQKYGARVFWDSDIWMFPALALLDPGRAKSIVDFRIKTRKAAERQAYEWSTDAGVQFHPTRSSYKFSWEAGPNGEEMAPGESRHQEHITADVAFSASTSAALGLTGASDAESLVAGCAQYLWHRATRLPDGQWGVLDTMSPDEFHTGDNDLYTNIATEQCLKKGFSDRWKNWSFKRPRDSTTFLTYDGDGLKAYKQAAALLAIWPLQDPACEKEATQMLDRFAGKTTPNGPAMSRSVEALIRARYGDKEVAYQEWRESWQKYTKRPVMMFSEAPNGKNAYFLTGAAGCLDAFLYGFVGLRIDDHDPGTKPWKTPLKNGYWLSCQPHLPEAWKSVTIDGLTVLGKRYRLVASGETVKVNPQSQVPSP